MSWTQQSFALDIHQTPSPHISPWRFVDVHGSPITFTTKTQKPAFLASKILYTEASWLGQSLPSGLSLINQAIALPSMQTGRPVTGDFDEKDHKGRCVRDLSPAHSKAVTSCPWSLNRVCTQLTFHNSLLSRSEIQAYFSPPWILPWLPMLKPLGTPQRVDVNISFLKLPSIKVLWLRFPVFPVLQLLLLRVKHGNKESEMSIFGPSCYVH